MVVAKKEYVKFRVTSSSNHTKISKQKNSPKVDSQPQEKHHHFLQLQFPPFPKVHDFFFRETSREKCRAQKAP